MRLVTAIPARLVDRPRVGGLVVPWVVVALADGTFDLGNMQNTRVNTAFMRRLCQIDGQPLGDRMVFFVPGDRLGDMVTSEPALHPECAAYSARVCPMVAGRMTRYRSTPTRTEGHVGQRCGTPGCECGGWVPTPGTDHQPGRAADSWHAVWCADYTVTVPDEETRDLVKMGVIPAGRSLGARIDQPLKVRPVRRGST